VVECRRSWQLVEQQMQLFLLLLLAAVVKAPLLAHLCVPCCWSGQNAETSWRRRLWRLGEAEKQQHVSRYPHADRRC
jgi:hypothetical protein